MSIYDTLNEQQKQGVFTTEGPVLLLAGAGSGKTRVLTHRIAYLIEEKQVNPYNIMAITFTNKAAGEMRERVDNIVGFGAESIWVSTFHSTCVRILRRYIDRLGYSNHFTIYDADDQKSVIKEVCKRLNIDTKIYKEKTLMSAISNAKDELITPDEMEAQAGADFNKKKIAAVYREYQKQLKSSNALDFDDLIFKTVELFREDEEVLDYYQERFKYIMVDEYQDTNTAQFKLISLLAGKYKNLCVVGDDDQSIYKFRGANIRNILNFEDTFDNATVIKLEQNYRSTQPILDAANAVIKNNLGRKEKKLWTEKKEGDKIRFNIYENGNEEAANIVGDIQKKVREEGYEYKDCAVLYRTNAQSRALEEKFVVNNVPYRVFGGVNFYARKEIKDILAYLKTVDNGQDDLAVKRIINVPKRGIGATTVDRVQTFAIENGISFYEALENARMIPSIGKSYTKLEPFVEYIGQLKSKAQYMSVKDLIEDILEGTQYITSIKETEDEEEAQDRISNIDEFISKAAAYEENCEEEPSLSGFLEEVALIADIDNLDESNNRVSLMTLHSAKGLEFPVVYLAGMEDGLFPSYMTITSDDPTEVEEERRLCYVGITRAMKVLNLSCAKMRMIRGETQYNKVSRFIKEIPPQLLESNQREIKQPQMDNGVFKNANMYGGATLTPFASSYTRKPNIVTAAKNTSYASPAKSMGNPSTGKLSYGVGDTVKHMKFGTGVVKNIVEGRRDYEVTVDFATAGVKKMFASFAKLVKC